MKVMKYKDPYKRFKRPALVVYSNTKEARLMAGPKPAASIKLLKYITQYDGVTVNDAAEALKWTPPHIRVIIRRLRFQGLIEFREIEGMGGSWFPTDNAVEWLKSQGVEITRGRTPEMEAEFKRMEEEYRGLQSNQD